MLDRELTARLDRALDLFERQVADQERFHTTLLAQSERQAAAAELAAEATAQSNRIGQALGGLMGEMTGAVRRAHGDDLEDDGNG